ncbi:hypothetical protein MMS29_26330, partial [Escherichia coli]|nr:hypothetical protein [Escherichia coli]
SYLGSSSRKLFEPKRKPPRKGGFFLLQKGDYLYDTKISIASSKNTKSRRESNVANRMILCVTRDIFSKFSQVRFWVIFHEVNNSTIIKMLPNPIST